MKNALTLLHVEDSGAVCDKFLQWVSEWVSECIEFNVPIDTYYVISDTSKF